MGRADGRKSGRGGARPGAGKPRGTKQILEYGQVKAVKAAGLRIPEGTPQEAREVADESLGVIIEAMRGQLGYLDGPFRLKAAAMLREEICGPVKQRFEHTGPNDGPLQVSIEINRTVRAENIPDVAFVDPEDIDADGEGER